MHTNRSNSPMAIIGRTREIQAGHDSPDVLAHSEEAFNTAGTLALLIGLLISATGAIIVIRPVWIGMPAIRAKPSTSGTEIAVSVTPASSCAHGRSRGCTARNTGIEPVTPTRWHHRRRSRHHIGQTATAASASEPQHRPRA